MILLFDQESYLSGLLVTVIFLKVVRGLDNFLFKLLILQVVRDQNGNVWRRRPTDMYVVEITTDKSFEALTTEESFSNENYGQVTNYWMSPLFRLLPKSCMTSLKNYQWEGRGGLNKKYQ